MEFLSLKADFIDCRLLKAYVKNHMLKAHVKSTAHNYLFKKIIKALEQGVNYVQS